MSVSIVCCYNDENKYIEYLLMSLKKQVNCDYELIGIDNTQKKFKNCADALNWGVSQASFENIVCIHQDFEFIGNDSLAIICDQFKETGEYDVFGFAGAVYDSNANFVERLVCRNRICIDSFSLDNIREKEMRKVGTEVETLDECCFCFKKSLWKKHHFSEALCPYWDLYAVEMCLYSRCYLDGRVMVIPFSAIHHSYGYLTINFYKSLYSITIFYRKKINRIVTTCVSTGTEFPGLKYIWLCLINFVRGCEISRIKEKLKGIA